MALKSKYGPDHTKNFELYVKRNRKPVERSGLVPHIFQR